MRRPPYSQKVKRGILLLWKKMGDNFDHGFVPYTWTRQDCKDAQRALQWLGDIYDWIEWKEAEKKRLEEEMKEFNKNQMDMIQGGW